MYLGPWNLTRPRAILHLSLAMSEPRRPTHLHRTKWTKRAQLLLAMLGAAFVLYRVIAVFVLGRP